MRTKNAKRLWPVPATLAVMAVAALLAFGLMATTGAQPAAAQAKADCTVMLNAQGTGVTAEDCTAMGDTAIVEFVGNTEHTEDATLSILIADKSGPITAYPNGTLYVDATGFSNDSAKYRYQTVELPEPAPDSQGIVQPAKVRVTVPGEVLIWVGTGTDVTSSISDAPNNERQISGGGDAPAETLTITFLGMPALGEDLDSDYNKKLDDVIMDQCIVQDDNDANDASQRLVGEVAANACPSADTATGREAGDWEEAPVTRPDVVESRSKLVVRAGEADASSGTAQAVIDGTEVTHIVGATDTAVTIYALIKDAKDLNLLESPVDFTATTNPTGIISARELSDDPETATVIISGTPGEGEIFVDGLDTPGADVPVTAEIDADDAVASFTLDDLNEIEGAFSITVNVMAGDLDLGTVIITRPDDPATLHAGIFTIDCFTKAPDATAYSDAKFNMDNDDCEAMGDSGRFGHGQMVVVKAHLEDSLGNVVGASDELDSELTSEDDNLLGDGEMTTIENPVENKIMPRAWVYTIDKDASLGDHMITVSTTATGKDSEGDDVDIGDVMLTVTVAGPPASLEISGDGNVDLGSSETFMVTARDAEGDIPHLTTSGPDQNDMVIVLIQPNTALVDGLNASNQVMLDPETGTAEFTVFAALDAEDGDHGRIIARLGDLQDIEPITFGLVVGLPGMPMSVSAEATSHDMITVSWEAPTDTGNSDITGYMVQSAYMMSDGMMSDWMDVDPAHMGMDMMYMDMGLMAETTYYYRVAAMNSVGMGEYSDGMAMDMTMAEDMPPDGEMLTSPSGVDAASLPGTGAVSVSWTPGQNATQHWVVLFSLPGYDVGGRVEVLNDPDANFQVFKNVPNGEYEVVVASYDPDTGFQYQDGIGMVTVE